MTHLHTFASIDGVEVMLYPGQVSIEPILLFKHDDELVEMTLSSTIYENELGEFMFHEGLSGTRKVIAEKVMNEIASNVERLGQMLMFTLKPAYKEKLMKRIEEEIKLGRYYHFGSL